MTTNSNTDAKAVVQRYIDELVNERRYEVAEEVFAEDYTRHDEQYSPEEVVEQLETFEAFPDLEVTIGAITAEDSLVTVRATARGTHEHEFGGIEPTGETVEMPGIMMHRVEDGKIVESWTHWDVFGMLHQLGAIPEETVQQTPLMRLREWLVRDNPPRRIPHS